MSKIIEIIKLFILFFIKSDEIIIYILYNFFDKIK